MMINYSEFTEINAEKRFGKPSLKGTRISVYDALNWLANSMSADEIVTDFPELILQHIHACLAYAADKEHRLRIAS